MATLFLIFVKSWMGISLESKDRCGSEIHFHYCNETTHTETKLIEIDDGEEFVKENFTKVVAWKPLWDSHYTWKGTLYADYFKTNFRDGMVSLKRVNAISLMNKRSWLHITTIHSMKQLTWVPSTLRWKVGNFLIEYVKVKRKRLKFKYQLRLFVSTPDTRNTFPEGDTTDWSFNICTIGEFSMILFPS